MKTGALYVLLLSLLAKLPDGNREKLSQSAVSGTPATAGMLKIAGGKFRSFLHPKNQPGIVYVQSFLLDEHAVTNADFLAFVKVNPEWSRSRTPRIFADNNYLSQWAGDLEIGNRDLSNCP